MIEWLTRNAESCPDEEGLPPSMIMVCRYNLDLIAVTLSVVLGVLHRVVDR